MSDQDLTPARFQLLQAHFERALDLPAEERRAFLDAVTRDDAELAAQVRSLLQAHDQTGTALESPVSSAVIRAAVNPDDRWVGTRVGVYQIVRLIGAGGMGTVYEAVRADDQYQKRVAIKLLRHHAPTNLAMLRFKAERQILANLTHKNIAGLLDGGVTSDGQPFFVLEYVEGEPLTQWADARHLPVRGRLTLFRQVCAAVQYAHQSLVVHRDLKPGNILVTGDGTVKLLDFGIAKLLRDDDGAGTETLTQVGARAYTPEFASPEQVRGLPVGTRSDVYALGVVLFELLAGVRPFDLQGKAPAEIERIVCEEPPPRPSAVLRDDRAPLLAERSPARARAGIEGDLDAIVSMALRKEPERRYGSADQLARDIQSHLDGHPVSARPDGLGYRLKTLIRRRRAEAVAFGLAVLFLVGGSVATALKAREAAAERDRATEVKDFLTTMLGAANPSTFGRDVQVRVVLDSAVGRLGQLKNRPALAAEIRSIIGDTYLALGEFELAETQYREAVVDRQGLAPRGDYATGAALSELAMALEYQGQYEAADSVARLATALVDRFPPKDPIERVNHLDIRGRILHRLGKTADAAPLMREVLRVQLESAPEDYSSLAYSYGNLGNVIAELGDIAGAESLFVAGLTAARRAHGETHPRVAEMLSLLAVNRDRAGRVDQADSTYRAAVDMRRKLLGAEHPEYALGLVNYAGFLIIAKKYGEAARWCREILKLRGRTLDEAHPALSTAMQTLGKALDRMDSLPEGERWLRESLAVRQANYGPDHWLIASSQSVLGEHFVFAKRYAEAERLLVDSERALVAARGEEAPVIIDARSRLVALYQAWGKPKEAAEWQARIPPAAK